MKSMQIALVVILGTSSLAAASPRYDDMRSLSSRYDSEAQVEPRGHGKTAADVHFNSTESLEDGSASGLGSGPGGGSPNGD